MLNSSAASLSFGSIVVGAHSALSFTLTNIGASTVDITSITSTSSMFTAAPAIVAVRPTHSCSISVTFLPTLAGEAAAELQILFHPPQSLMRLSLSGTGVVPKHKDSKETKEVKETKEAKESVVDKTADRKPTEHKGFEVERIAHSPVVSGTAEPPGSTLDAEEPIQHAFITPDERPHLGQPSHGVEPHDLPHSPAGDCDADRNNLKP